MKVLLRISYLAYAQHALNNPKKFKTAPPPKKLCEMSWGPLLKAQERFLNIFMFKSFYGGLNKNELLSVLYALPFRRTLRTRLIFFIEC